MREPAVVTITTYEHAREAFRQKALRQGLYDEGEVVMADVLVNLHGDEHRARRRLENRLFRRDTQERYEHDLFHNHNNDDDINIGTIDTDIDFDFGSSWFA